MAGPQHDEEAGRTRGYRRPGRPGVVGQSDVDQAANELLRLGQSITQDAIVGRTGGSKGTVAPLLKDWWRRLGDRVAAGPQAFERIPAPLAHLLEALYLRCVDEARGIVRQEEAQTRSALAETRQDLDARSYALSLREEELNQRLKRSELERESLRSELSQRETELRTCRANADARDQRSREELHALQRTLSRTVLERAELSSKLEARERDLALAEMRLKDLTAEHDALTSNANALEMRVADAQKRRGALELEIERLREELRVARRTRPVRSSRASSAARPRTRGASKAERRGASPKPARPGRVRQNPPRSRGRKR